jgi:fibronectin-binding autotransporter adhesin
MTEIQVTTKTTTAVTLTSGGNTYLTVGTSGEIYNLGLGVTAAFAYAGLSITNAGTLIGGNGGQTPTYGIPHQAGTGVVVQTGGSLFNTGAITGGAGFITYIPGSVRFGGGTGLDLNGFGTNSGHISGGVGVYGDRSVGTNGGLGVNLTGGSLQNSGTITGGQGGNSHEYKYSPSYGGPGGGGVNVSGGATLVNTGVIAGGGGGAGNLGLGNSGNGVYVKGGTLITSGTISGGNAVLFGAAAGRLIVEQGAVFNGNVLGNGGFSDVLELAAGALGTGSYTLSGIGEKFAGFNTIALDAGPAWLLAGGLIGETITGFTKADTLDLTGTVTNGISIISGGAILLNGSSTIGTIDLSGSFPLAYLDLASDGAGGTELLYVSNGITGTIATGITLSSASTTVFSHGLVENSTGAAVVSPGSTSRTLVNYGTITGTSNGVSAQSAAETLINAGSIYASTGDAVYFGAGGSISNSGSVIGKGSGIVVHNAAGSIGNSGFVAGTTAAGILLASGGAASNSGTGHISGVSDGVFIAIGAGTLANAGSISASTGDAVYFGAGGSASITSTGRISGAGKGVVIKGGAGTINNAGSIGGAGSDGIYLNDGGSVSNTGTISGHTYGALITGATATLTNTGAISGSAASGIALLAGGMVGNTSSTGHITGATNGISVQGGAGMLTNAGSIFGTSGDGVYFGDGGSLSNSGSIAGAGGGIVILNAQGSIGDTGTISSTGGDGIELGAGGMVSLSSTSTVKGSIYGVFVQGAAGIIVNAGSIAGANKAGIALAAGGTLVDSGTISGNGTAVSFAGGGGLLVMEHGAVFNGNVAASGAGNTLELTSYASAGILSGIGTKYTGFQTISIDTGAAWTISGTLLGETVTGFSRLDTLDLTGITANGESTSGGVLTLTENGVTIGTLNLAGQFAPGSLAIQSDANGGTLIDLAGTLTGSYGSEITLQYRQTTISNSAIVNSGSTAVDGPVGTKWTLLNKGTLEASSYGVVVGSGSTVDNSGVIQVRQNGVYLTAGGGVVSNAAQGTITAYGDGVLSAVDPGTVLNAGVIRGVIDDGIALYNSGTVTNLASGTIAGDRIGIYIYGPNGSTVVNAGTVIGGSNYGAIILHGGGGSRVVEDAGAVVEGAVRASGSNNVLELGAGNGMLSGIGTAWSDFGTIVLDTSATWQLAGTLTGETISGLGGGDSLTFTNVTATSMTFSGGVLTLYNNGKSVGTAHYSGQFDANDLSLSSGAGGTTISIAAQTIAGNSGGITLENSATTIAAGANVSANNAYAVNGARNETWQVTNFGNVTNSSGMAVSLYQGSVTNASSGTIFSHSDVGVYIHTGTIINAGIIGSGQYTGVYLVDGTLINSGTIIGGNFGVAVHATGDIGPARVVVDPGAVFIGNVEAVSGTKNVLGLASATTAGTLSGIGSQFTGFDTIDFYTGSTWTASGNESGFNHDTITGFTGRDKIDFISFAATPGVIALTDTDVLTIGDLSLTFTSADTGELFIIASDGSGGTDLTVACFLAGTHISTPGGEVAVESLKAGELVLTADGQSVPIRWIGVRRVVTRFADRLRAYPIRIQAGALADGIPMRDLLVSPDHAMFLGGILVQAGALVNGTSITREADMPASFTYYHVEVADHTLILAEGAATETFVDNADRMNFDNWVEHEVLHAYTPPIAELPYARAKSARQVPPSLRHWLAQRALANAAGLQEQDTKLAIYYPKRIGSMRF